MTNTIDQMSQAIGRIEQKVDDLVNNFNKLPCGMNRKDIDELQDYKNQMVGKISIISIVFGAVGAFVTMVLNHFLNK